VLYLYDNKIETVSGLQNLPLKRLYLQNNCIPNMNGIDGLHCLEILNLSGNCLNTVHFTDLPSLAVLQVDKQKVKGLTFSKDTCEGAFQLRKLTATSNGITDIDAYKHFTKLEEMNLSNNCLATIEVYQILHSHC
jgi:Leucine Rich Repeat